MGRPRKQVPTLTRHRPTGQARVRIGGRDVYLGRFGSQQAREAYARLVAEVSAVGDEVIRNLAQTVPASTISVAELCLAWKEHAERTYTKAGRSTSTVATFATPIRVLRELYGLLPVGEFGPLKLEVVRHQLVNLKYMKRGRVVAANLCRGVVNAHIARIRKVFRWGCSRELVPASVVQALGTLEPLKAGRTSARDTMPVRPVEDTAVNAVLPHLPDVVADMVRLQRLTGMRPSEVCNLRPIDVDRSDNDVWQYRPLEHKTMHKDR